MVHSIGKNLSRTNPFFPWTACTVQEEFKPLTKWWKDLLGSEVSQVRVSRRLAKTPAIVVAGQYGYSANLEKVMRSQAISDPRQAALRKAKERILEVNPKHPLVEELKARVRSLAARPCGLNALWHISCVPLGSKDF